MADDKDILHADLCELLTILGMGDHARPQPPHEVFQEALGVLRKRVSEFERWTGLTDAIREIADMPADWPDHGNAPLAIAAGYQLLKMDEKDRINPRPLAEWNEEIGFVTWWILPVCEPAWIGSPNCSDWPGYHTHWTPHPPCPAVEPKVAS